MSISAVSSRQDSSTQELPPSYTIQRGDTLSSIAAHLGVSVSALMQANPQIRNPNVIYAGDRLDVPGGGTPAGNAGQVDASAPAANDATGGRFDYNRIDGVQGNPNVTPAFIKEVEAMAARLGTKPEYLMAVMSFETGGSFSPAQKNNAGSGATGLIQFMPATAEGMGTSTAALARMSAVEQLEYVEQYFMERAGAQNGKLSTVEGVYTAVLYGTPKADPNATLWSRGSTEYSWNSGLDANRDGRITAGEAASAVRGRVSGNLDSGGPAPAPTPGDDPAPGNGNGSGNAGGSYTVRSGDTLSQIAASHGMSLDALIVANPQIRNPDLIHPGDTIHLSGGGGGQVTVQSGDTMWGIANRNGVSLAALVDANPQVRNPNLIYPGQELNLPGTSIVTTGGTRPDPVGGTAPSGSTGGNGDVVSLAESFLGRNASDLKRSGELPMESWVPNDVNCANFVTAVLQEAGLINWHDNTVAGTASRLKAEGWTVVPASQAKPGDVCILNYGGHVELVASNNNGDVQLIGSNNINPDGSQQVSYGNPYGNAYYLTPP